MYLYFGQNNNSIEKMGVSIPRFVAIEAVCFELLSIFGDTHTISTVIFCPRMGMG